MFRTFETTLAGRPLVIETGKMAQLANGHCLVRYGDTVVMVNVTASRSPREGVDFFPLSVDYEEKLYSVGKIPGGYIKREGKPSEKAILTSRVIDRPIRPLFPSDLRNDVSVVATVLSVEQDNPPEVAAMIGTSIAISISDVPWNGPIGGVWLGLVDGEYVINPTVEQREKSEMLVTVAGTKQKVVMIEAGANEVEESVIFEGIKFATKGNRVQDISHAVQTYVESNGFAVVRDFVGHGVGRQLHEEPEVPNFGAPGRGPRLLPGMTIAVEPMVNVGTYEVKILSDGWTTVTADGKLAAHYENTVLITDGEPEILTVTEGL